MARFSTFRKARSGFSTLRMLSKLAAGEKLIWTRVIPTEESIHTLISTRNHFLVGEIQADLHDFKNIKKCYVQVNGSGVRNYVETLLQFASKALRVSIPPRIYKQLHALENPTSQ